MKANWRALDAELKQPELQVEQGRLARRPLGRVQGRRDVGRSAPRQHRRRDATLKDIGAKITAVPQGLPCSPHIQRFLEARPR